MNRVNVPDPVLARLKSAQPGLLAIGFVFLVSIGIGWAACQATFTDTLWAVAVAVAISVAGASALAVPELLLGGFLAGMSAWVFLPSELASRMSGYLMPLTIALAGLAMLLRYRFRPISIDRMGRALLILSGYLFISVLWTSAPQNGLYKASAFFLNTVVLYFLVRWAYHRRLVNLWRLVVIIAMLGLLPLTITVMAWTRVGLDRSASLNYFFISQTKFDVYALTNSLQLAMICATALWLRNGGRMRRWFWLGLAGMEFWALVSLGQRAQLAGSLLAFGVLVAARNGLSGFASFTRRRMGPRSVFLGVLSVLVLSSIALAFTNKLNLAYMASDPSISSRFQFYQWGLTGSVERPMLGHGLGSFSFDFFGVDARVFSHNILVDMLYEGGLVGLVLFLAILYIAYAYARFLVRNPGANAGLGVLGLALLVGRLFVVMFSADVSSLAIGPWLAMMTIPASQHSSGLPKVPMVCVAEKKE